MADLTTATIGGGSSELVKRNPQFHVGGSGPASLDLQVPLYNGHKPLTFFEVDFGTAVNTQLDPEEAISVVIEVIAQYCTIVIRGDLHSTNQVMTFAVEQPNDSLDYDGAGAETLVEQIEDEIIALGDQSSGTPNQIDYTGVTCTVKTSLNLA